MSSSQRIIPIFTTRGVVGAYLVYPYLYNPDGEWIGWMARNRQVYSIQGNYVGWMNDDPRILRKLSTSHMKPRLTTPPPPGRLSLPEESFNTPIMADLKSGTFDVLENAPDLLPPQSALTPVNNSD